MEECSASFYHKEAQHKLAAASQAYEEWKQGERKRDWLDAVRGRANWSPNTSRSTARRFRRGVSGLKFTAFVTLP
jgi:hypothetical protein